MQDSQIGNIIKLPWAAAMADMVATSTEAEEDTPLPSGTVEDTCTPYMDNRNGLCKCLLNSWNDWLLKLNNNDLHRKITFICHMWETFDNSC